MNECFRVSRGLWGFGDVSLDPRAARPKDFLSPYVPLSPLPLRKVSSFARFAVRRCPLVHGTRVSWTPVKLTSFELRASEVVGDDVEVSRCGRLKHFDLA